MAGARHLVARQTIEIVTSRRGDADALMARASAAAPALAAAIERTLDAYDTPGQRIRLDTVVIDLGVCDPQRLEDALVAGIERELGARLPGALAHDRAATAADTSAEAALLLLTGFMRSGRLPWWSDAADTPALAVARLAAARSAADACPPETLRALLAAPGAIDRCVFQFGDTALAALVRLAEPGLADGLAGDVAAIVAAVTRVAAGQAVVAGRVIAAAPRASVWRAVLRQATGQLPPGPPPGRDTVEVLLAALPQTARSGAAGWFWTGVAAHIAASGALGSVTGAAPATGRPAPAAPPPAGATAATVAEEDDPAVRLAARLKMLAASARAGSALLAHLAGLAPRLDAAAATAALQALGTAAAPAPAIAAVVRIFAAAGAVGGEEAEGWIAALAATAAPPVADDHDAIAIENAGLPLLWRFLPAFFDGAGLLGDGAFIDVAARHRAVTLLHHLASGERTAPEAQLPLCKLLAGLDLDDVYDPGAPLGDDDDAAGEALLAAIIGHAPMLGTISPAGLRATFLQRSGLLTTRDGHWLLRVERRDYDVLLDRLPWSFGWVRLAWMAAPLQIEW